MSNLTDHPWDHINPAGFPTPELPNHGYRVWLALMVMVITSGLFVIARIATRVSARQMGSDDYAILASLASFIVQTTFWALSVRTGYGADYLKLNTYYRELFNKWWFLGSIFYLLTIALYKTSVILLLRRIFVQRGFQIVCWCMLVVNTCWGLGNLFSWTFECLPVEAMWGAVPARTCVDLKALWITLAVWDVSTDVIILTMPIPMVWKLNLKNRDKLMVIGVFLLGAIVVVFSLMSCSAIVSSLQSFGQANHYTFGLANLFQVLESGMGIIGACLPIMRQPLIHMFPSLLRSHSSRRRPRYDEDHRASPYGLQDLSGRQKDVPHATWHSVSVSSAGPQRFKVPPPRESDELGMISDTGDTRQFGNGHSQSDMYDRRDRW